METFQDLIQRCRGVLTCRDAPPTRLRKLVQRGRLISLLPGVFVVPELRHEEDALIRAVLAYRSDAVVCGFAAARRTFWGSAPTRGKLMVANAHTRVRRPGFAFTPTLVPVDLTVERDGVRLTSPARTALDLAVETGARSVDEVLRSGQATLDDLWQAFSATPYRRGNDAIRTLLDDSRDTPWSADERLFHRALRERGITGWSANQRVVVGDVVVFPDVGFQDLRLAIEIDGRHHRDDESTFQTDRERQNLLVLGQWCVLRYTGTQLNADMNGALEQVEHMLCWLRGQPSQNRRHSPRPRSRLAVKGSIASNS